MARFALNIAFCVALLAPAAQAQPYPPIQETADLYERGLKTSDFPRTKELAHGVYSYEALRSGNPGSFMTTVSLIVTTDDGVLVADGQGSEKDTAAMIEVIKTLTSKPIKYVVVCSDHGDHTNGNPAFKAAFPDVVFISSPASQKVMATKPFPPTETVSDKRVIRMGGTKIEILNLGRAHTGGDLTVFVPADNVLFLGEIYFHRLFPAMRTAYPSEWLATIKKAQAMNAAWYIPGHGFVDDQTTMKAELEAYRKSLEYVVNEAKRLHDAKVPCVSATDCEAAIRADWGPYAGWSLRFGQEGQDTFRVYQELDGQLP